ncbi:hypothetical protein [Streptomyces sp. NPDC007346]|uniref:hypothetical protein n=1 Tax=Streptomyces sp. NPDC007346 TaxID=3154682 RepID=UPI003452B828
MNGPLKPVSSRSLVAVQASELSELPKRDVHPIAIEIFEIRLRQLIEVGPQDRSRHRLKSATVLIDWFSLTQKGDISHSVSPYFFAPEVRLEIDYTSKWKF